MVRQAKIEELDDIVQVHYECFPDSFSTQSKMIKYLYKEYFDKVPELFFVAENKGQLVGLCMGYYCDDNNYVADFVRHNRVKLALRTFVMLLACNKLAWGKVFSKFKKKGEKKIHKVLTHIPITDEVDLLSICVLPSERGQNVSGELIEAYTALAKSKGKRRIYLTVRTDNNRAISYYKKHGYDIVYEDGDGYKMAREL